MIQPPFLQTNDRVRIVSPSGHIDPVYIDGAKRIFTEWGLRPDEGKHAQEKYGRFAGTDEQRTEDLQEALNHPDIKAILCSRGGYGLARIIDRLDFTAFKKNPKWLIGFSDITVLHNAISLQGVNSLHSIMAKHLTVLAPDSQPVIQLRQTLFGNLPAYSSPVHPLNRPGIVRGKLTGGNLSVLSGLRGSKFDLDFENTILFIEDIAEKPYHIDRMIQNLRLSGAFEKISGLILGQFSDCEEDPFMHGTIHELIYEAVKDYKFPVCFNFPVGHVEENLPLICGADVQLKVTEQDTLLSYL